jgi:beta-N-acetylhexosaminidase
MASRAVIFGCEGAGLLDAERRFFAEADPWGFILFARNIETPEQVARLTAGLRESVGRDAPVLIDQEGGRVARMRAPSWREWLPALEEVSRLPDRALRARAMHLRYRLIADELRLAGIDINCAPVLDAVRAQTHPIIRDRCYGSDAVEISEIGRAVADGLLSGGVVPVMKHIPGQGRADADSHKDLPFVRAEIAELRDDFAPFKALCDLPVAMTGHVVYQAIDPDAPATQSAAVVDLIRDEIGFDGLLLTDDLSMHALTGSFGDRVQRSVAAGCDVVLHCNGQRQEMEAVAGAAPVLSGQAAVRADRALAARTTGVAAEVAAMDAEFAALRERVANA